MTDQRHCKKWMDLTCQAALNKQTCAVCWETHFTTDLESFISTEPATAQLLGPLVEHGDCGSDKASFECKEEKHNHLDGYPLTESGMFVTPLGNSMVRVCHTCVLSLKKRAVPPRSIANKLWIGDQTAEMKKLSVPAKLLTSTERTKCYVMKLKSYANPKNKQRGYKGMSIAYPQLNHLRYCLQCS